MQVDGRVVGKALAAAVRPALRDLGFHRFQGRHSWRRGENMVDLVTFGSMSAHTAEGVGCTSYSFDCAVGVYYPILNDSETEWPRDYHLTFRGFPGKTIRQPFFHPWGLLADELEGWRKDRADIWYVLEDGSNLDEVAADALNAVLVQGIPFIDRLHDPQQAVQFLLTEPDRDTGFGQIGSMVGGIGCPNRLNILRRLAPLV